MTIHRLGVRFGLRFKSNAPSFLRVTLIPHPPAVFPPNVRQFSSRPGFEYLWRWARVQRVFRFANSVFPARSVRTLRKGLVPGGLAYNIAKGGEASVEKNITGGPGTSNAATMPNKSGTLTLRTSRLRRMSTKQNGNRQQREPSSSNQAATQGSKRAKNGKSENSESMTEEGSSYFHRPTKEQLLATATSFYHRLHIRFKWPLIRSLRPFNMDDISAFISVYLLSHAFLLIAGTTTFFLFVIATINSVGAQEYLARLIGWYLTKESGMTVVFESAIVPKWRSKTIRFERVFVSRRPKGAQGNYVRKGSSVTAAAAAAAATQVTGRRQKEEAIDDGNYTQYDLTIESVDVTLSFVKWMNGKGLLENVEMRGVRGVVDRTHVRYNPLDDPIAYRHKHVPGDFELDSFRMEDLLVTVYQPDNFRPFTVSIFSCDLPKLRKHWFFYDFLCANNMSGTYDNSLFTLHPRQTPSSDKPETGKVSRLRIDGVNVDHLNRGVDSGMFSWVVEGKVDVIADLCLPVKVEKMDLGKIVEGLRENIETIKSTNGLSQHPQEHVDEDTLYAPPRLRQQEDEVETVRFDIMVCLNDVRAVVPYLTPDLSYINNALIRPIVAYINSRRTHIPVKCQVIKPLEDFDGAWGMWDSLLFDAVSAEVYAAFANSVSDLETRRRRMKKVALWSLQLGAQVLMMSASGVAAPA